MNETNHTADAKMTAPDTQPDNQASLTAPQDGAQTAAQAAPAQPAGRKTTQSKHLGYVYQAEEALKARAAKKAGTDENQLKQPGDAQSLKAEASPAADKQTPGGKQPDANAEAERKAPENWTEQDKKAFAALPQEGKQIVLNIQKNLLSGWNKKMQQASQYKNAFEEVAGGLAPFTRRFKNMAEFTAHLHDVESFENEMKRNPVRTLAVLAERAGVDLAALAGYQPNPAEEAVLPIQHQMTALRQRLEELAAGHASQQQPAHAETDAHAQEAQSIANFAQVTDERGNPLHPYFDRVARLMGVIMLQEGHDDMQRAYDQAIELLPEVRAERRRAEQAQKQRAEELEKAKRAAALKTRSTPGTFVPEGKKRKSPLDYIFEAEQRLAEK